MVDDEFHARFSATARRYRYILYCNKLRSAILPEGITHCHLDLDEKKMHQAGQFLLGENDFSSFRAAQCQSNTPWRNVHHLNVVRKGQHIYCGYSSECLCASYGTQHCGKLD